MRSHREHGPQTSVSVRESLPMLVWRTVRRNDPRRAQARKGDCSMTCRNQPRCRRDARPDSPYCVQCVDRMLTEAFGPPPTEQARVRRLSTDREAIR